MDERLDARMMAGGGNGSGGVAGGGAAGAPGMPPVPVPGSPDDFTNRTKHLVVPEAKSARLLWKGEDGEEIAYDAGWIDRAQLLALAAKAESTDYGHYLKHIAYSTRR